MTPPYSELLRALGTEAALVGGALVVLGIDLFGGRGRASPARLRIASYVGLFAIAVAVYRTIQVGIDPADFGAVLTLDSLALVTRVGVLVLAALTLALVPGVLRVASPAEYVAVVLFATAGFTLMAAAQQLLVAFLALELASLSLYVLAGFDKTRAASAEAGLKYFLFGGISAAFLLFGFSLIYGLTGSIELSEIARQLHAQAPSPLLMVALTMVLVSFGFKAAAAPFHLWAPDTYEGAPPSSAALIASASKLAGFALFLRLLWHGAAPVSGNVATPDTTPGWLPTVALISAASLLLGNIAALAQSNVRRLLAYSAIGHAGALLIGVMAAQTAGPAPLIYYAATYGLATVGAFGVIAVLDGAGGCQQISDLAGLHRRSPLLAGCLLVFVLSLAGIPPLAGFFGKFVVFAGALKINGVAGPIGWLTILAILLTAVALYYYLLMLKQALVAAPADGAGRVQVPVAAAAALVLICVLLLGLGIFPSVVLQLLT
jgi:NADH-quinone oxidoreductase subunit N